MPLGRCRRPSRASSIFIGYCLNKIRVFGSAKRDSTFWSIVIFTFHFSPTREENDQARLEAWFIRATNTRLEKARRGQENVSSQPSQPPSCRQKSNAISYGKTRLPTTLLEKTMFCALRWLSRQKEARCQNQNRPTLGGLACPARARPVVACPARFLNFKRAKNKLGPVPDHALLWFTRAKEQWQKEYEALLRVWGQSKGYSGEGDLCLPEAHHATKP